ncbi:uncharacterized protein LOC122342461 [Puntigrus tetrazona]|uniref:uncharacterized protein LOC122342461 n=1 Tax=Puntigrus tetrazona TaxID=1606681 RepID=UPI001C894224|nr:uncharacterized protein LOC122342461 [Puntigrus tetrazona]XP_043092202.1 uncharacterized protein LOC122342461 [Puntigrus tetrazona]
MARENQPAADVCQSSELSPVEMTEVEYLQHIIQSHIDAQVTETDSSSLSRLEESLYEEPEKRLACSPCRPEGTSVGPMDLLLLSDSNTTPVSGAEVPGSVLSRVQCVVQERPLEERPSPAARVCLEKRFLSVLCHSTNTSRTSTHAQMEKWSKTDKMVKIQGMYPYEGRLFKSGGQQSELVIPTVSFRAEKGSESVKRAPLFIYPDTADQQTTDTLKNEAVNKAAHSIKHIRTRPLRSSNIMQDPENWKPYTGMPETKRCRTGPLMDRTQRKEVHNRKERDRRRRIRLCCDELNLLVPFCYADTDKATTLQWTTAFLKYIQEIHGDRLKQDFQSTFCGKTGLRLKPSCVSMTLLESYNNMAEAADSSSHN